MTIERLASDYAALERRLHAAVAGLSHGICAACPAPCCDAGHCSQWLVSAWLRSVSRAAGASAPAAGDTVCFLEPDGCSLPAGRPIQCTAYICDRLSIAISEPLERFVYQAMSCLLPHIVREARHGIDLVDVEDLESLTESQRQRIARRIRDAGCCLDDCVALLDTREEARPTREVAARLLGIARTLPYAASAVRFDGETPSLSRAGRASLAKASKPGGGD